MKRLSLLTFLVVLALTIAVFWPPGLATAATPADNPYETTVTISDTSPPYELAATPPPGAGGTILRNEDILEYLRTAGTAAYLVWNPLAEKPDVRTVATTYIIRNDAMAKANNFGKRDRYRQQRE